MPIEGYITPIYSYTVLTISVTPAIIKLDNYL